MFISQLSCDDIMGEVDMTACITNEWASCNNIV